MFLAAGPSTSSPKATVKSLEWEYVGRESAAFDEPAKMAVVRAGDKAASGSLGCEHVSQGEAPHDMSGADQMASIDSKHDVQGELSSP
jgi:hypothetical protein